MIKAPSLYLFNGNPRSRYQRSGAANNFENEFGAAGRFFGGIVKSLLSEEKDESKKGKAKRKIDQNGRFERIINTLFNTFLAIYKISYVYIFK